MLDDPPSGHAAPVADITWLEIAGLDRTTKRRGLAIVSRETGARLAHDKTNILRVFAPIGRRISPQGVDG